MNYCEEKGISVSQLNEAQRTLYFIAENMKMCKSISEEGYEHFQQAIKALNQDNEVPDSIRNDIESLSKTYSLIFHSNGMLDYDEVLEIIDKYQTETVKLIKRELGQLFRGDEFYFEGTKYKSLYLKGNNFNNVVCKNLVTGKKEYFDIGTEVEVEDKK